MMRIRMRTIVSTFGAMAVLALGAEASADALRCGSRVITRGDHEVKLLHYCGEPIAVRTRVVQRSVVAFGSFFHPGLGLLEDVVIEEWTYNFGPRKLMRQVRIENGFVEDIRALGYGFREKK